MNGTAANQRPATNGEQLAATYPEACALPRGLAYDPWLHARRLGVPVVERPLRRYRWGEYHHLGRLIVLAPGMTAKEARCTLAHEVQHALAGDWWPPDPGDRAAMEARADARAAGLLIDPDEYEAAAAKHEAVRGEEAPFAGRNWDRAVLRISIDLAVIPEIVRDWRGMVSP